jgi:hypothetical protein
MKNVLTKLNKIQTELKSPKMNVNSFGKYKFRNVEDVCESLKPLLAEYKCAITLNDALILHGDRFYVEATASLYDCESEEVISNKAYAREDEHKGMSAEQNSGSASSYARKYALNGLFALDNSELDPDNVNKGGKDTQADIPEKEKVNTNEKISKVYVDSILDILANTNSDVDSFLTYMDIEKIEDMTMQEFMSKAKPALDAKQRKK